MRNRVKPPAEPVTQQLWGVRGAAGPTGVPQGSRAAHALPQPDDGQRGAEAR